MQCVSNVIRAGAKLDRVRIVGVGVLDDQMLRCVPLRPPGDAFDGIGAEIAQREHVIVDAGNSVDVDVVGPVETTEVKYSPQRSTLSVMVDASTGLCVPTSAPVPAVGVSNVVRPLSSNCRTEFWAPKLRWMVEISFLASTSISAGAGEPRPGRRSRGVNPVGEEVEGQRRGGRRRQVVDNADGRASWYHYG